MKTAFIIYLILIILLVPVTAWGGEISCQLSTNNVSSDIDPSGQIVTVTGYAPENAPVIINVVGPNIPEQVSLYQGNSWGRYSEVEVLGLPGFYQVLTSFPIEQVNERYWNLLGLNPDYEQLRSSAWVRVRQEAAGKSTLSMKDDYVKLALTQKNMKELYTVRQGVVARNGQKFSAVIPLIAGMPLGQLKVTAMTLLNNQVVFSTPETLNVKSTSLLTTGSKELSINALVVIFLFMLPIVLLTVGQILEILEERKRMRQLRNIWYS